MLFKGTRDKAFHSIYIHLLEVGYIVFIVSKGWQGRKSLSQWEAELTARGQTPKWRCLVSPEPERLQPSSEAYPQPERKWEVSMAGTPGRWAFNEWSTTLQHHLKSLFTLRRVEII